MDGWLLKISWLGKLVLVFWWVELDFFSLDGLLEDDVFCALRDSIGLIKTCLQKRGTGEKGVGFLFLIKECPVKAYPFGAAKGMRL